MPPLSANVETEQVVAIVSALVVLLILIICGSLCVFFWFRIHKHQQKLEKSEKAGLSLHDFKAAITEVTNEEHVVHKMEALMKEHELKKASLDNSSKSGSMRSASKSGASMRSALNLARGALNPLESAEEKDVLDQNRFDASPTDGAAADSSKVPAGRIILIAGLPTESTNEALIAELTPLGATVVDKKPGETLAHVLFKTQAKAKECLKVIETEKLLALSVAPDTPPPKASLLDGEALNAYWGKVQRRASAV